MLINKRIEFIDCSVAYYALWLIYGELSGDRCWINLMFVDELFLNFKVIEKIDQRFFQISFLEKESHHSFKNRLSGSCYLYPL